MIDDFGLYPKDEPFDPMSVMLFKALQVVAFLFFLARGMIPPGLKARLWTIFAGGAALGFVGWWMVSSGLKGTQLTSVSQYRLAFHLTLACAIYFAVLWTAQGLKARVETTPARLRVGALLLALMVLVQIYLGALVAGLDAARVFNTWPMIDGAFLPSPERLWFVHPAWRNLFENQLTVQFDHRMFADAVWVLAGLHAIDARQARRGGAGAVLLFVAVTLQAALGVVTLLYQAPLALALAHQGMAMIVFTIAIVHAQALWHGAAARKPTPLMAAAKEQHP